MSDILGKTLVDFYNGNAETLWINNRYGEPEELPIEVFFREKEDLTELEKIAILNCKGDVLDVGAGAGAISLLLQDDYETTAIESSEGACQVMKALGVRNGIIGDVFDYREGRFDTILLLMNGIGIAETINNLEKTLSHLKSLLNKNGQIILDSSDISYLYENLDKPIDNYYGQLEYQYQYKSEKGAWFNWLYVDYDTLKEHAENIGFSCELIFQDENDQYLVRLS